MPARPSDGDAREPEPPRVGIGARPSPLPRTGAPSSPTNTEPAAPALAPGWPDDPGPAPRTSRRGTRTARVRATLLAPPVLLTLAMSGFAVLFHRDRLGLDLAGGRILPLEGLGEVWASYLSGWHPTGGGSGAPAPASLAVLGVLGAPVASPAVAVSLLLLAAMPLAALSAYLATRAAPAACPVRALVAAGYALLPAATTSLVQGRLDVVVVHILLPLVLAGTVAVLRGGGSWRPGGWLSTACATALGLAVIGAFSPAAHLLVLAVALVGFVAVPAPRAVPLRRAVGLFAIVLLPLGLLLPWPAVVVTRPEVLLHGVGATVAESWPGWAQLLTLDPGGPGAMSWLGGLVIIAAVLAVLLRPSRAMLPGLVLLLFGLGAAVLIGSTEMVPLVGGAARPGFTGVPLLFASCGLLWVVLIGCRFGAASSTSSTTVARRGSRLAAVTGVLALLALAAGAALQGTEGALDDDDPGVAMLAPKLAAEAQRDGTWVFVVGDNGQPPRMTRGGTARFGDDAVAPLPFTVNRLASWSAALRGGAPGEVRATLAAVAASGGEFVVLARGGPTGAVVTASTGLARPAPDAVDGRPVLRLLRPNPGAVLLGPALAQQARSGSSPPIVPEATGVPVEADPPRVAARVAPGARGRLLVVAANERSGWQATVDGDPVPVVSAWGHLAGVDVPAAGAEVRVAHPDALRTTLLLIQAAVVLLTVATALPGRRRGQR